MSWMASEQHMPYMTAPTTAQAMACVLQISVFVLVQGVVPTAAYNSVQIIAQIMDSAKETNAYARKGKSFTHNFYSDFIVKEWGNSFFYYKIQ